MRVCPKCGYVDLSGWRRNRWRTNVEFIERSEFERLHPELARDLNRGHPVVTDKLYAYRLSGKPRWIVERIYIKEYEAGGLKAFHIPRERVNHSQDPCQTKLFNKSSSESIRHT